MKRFCIFLALLNPCAAYAEEDAVVKYYGWHPSQILEMSDEERRSSVPMMYIGAANLHASPFGEIVIRSNLNVLMYSGLGDLDTAIRAFQNDLGDEQTGDLTVGQIHQLGYRAERSNLTYVSFFSYNFGGTQSQDIAAVEGTVKILDDKIAYPVNHVWINCDRSEGICRYKQIALMLPKETDFTQSYHVGEIADDIYRITRWEGQQIDAVPFTPDTCRINQLSFNFASEEYFEIARNNSEGDCETLLGVALPRLEKPRISQIVDGREIIDAEFKKLGEEAYGYLSSDFRSKVDAIADKEVEAP